MPSLGPFLGSVPLSTDLKIQRALVSGAGQRHWSAALGSAMVTAIAIFKQHCLGRLVVPSFYKLSSAVCAGQSH